MGQGKQVEDLENLNGETETQLTIQPEFVRIGDNPLVYRLSLTRKRSFAIPGYDFCAQETRGPENLLLV